MTDPIGMKSLDEIWEELRRMALDMPILHQGFELQRFANLSPEYTAAAMALCLAGALKGTQKALIKAMKAIPGPPMHMQVWKENFS